MVIFPLGEFSDQIGETNLYNLYWNEFYCHSLTEHFSGIPRYCDTFLSLHCLVFAYRSCVAGVGN